MRASQPERAGVTALALQQACEEIRDEGDAPAFRVGLSPMNPPARGASRRGALEHERNESGDIAAIMFIFTAEVCDQHRVLCSNPVRVTGKRCRYRNGGDGDTA